MARILLVDDSSHAQRMGERILSDEGYEVVTVSNADSALIRLDDVAPDLVLADAVMPNRTGYDICHYVKVSPRHRHVAVVLTAGAEEKLDETELARVGADASLRKPFEASVLVDTVKPLIDEAVARRPAQADSPKTETSALNVKDDRPIIAVLDAERIRAAVAVALDSAYGSVVDQVTEKVLLALSTTPAKKS